MFIRVALGRLNVASLHCTPFVSIVTYWVCIAKKKVLGKLYIKHTHIYYIYSYI